jgi:16S rRNA (guanine966-N2)-methyltransferase
MNRKKAGTVRIIGGCWRGRRLPVADVPGLRPSGDRSRETLFNWLQADIRGARCADLFAGTGVLGLEAASRGASRVTLVEQSRKAAHVISESVEVLSSNEPCKLDVLEMDALTWLKTLDKGSLDIVFVDPPFGSGLEARVLELLEGRDVLAGGGLVYMETARESPSIPVPPGWLLVRDKVLGEVRMQLLRKE